ncbi:NF038122 family metalloprotease [Paludibaculum fermentans]|uniref:PEP-CTERM sorting domain-containing protein n=1 Tax=Paludibaculum fermentans TaxID=1473598 RepID=A0A7S7NV43_PALFE|nr:NF038122 family metalloprotease [Paludibaculum fermentans]QOY90392.1 PEP-CTERM sorting domain-containing protein [Paludibaculum fermentans]
MISLAVLSCALAAPAAGAAISWNAAYFNDAGLSAGDYGKFQSTINTALNYYSTKFQSPNAVTVNIEFHAGTTGLGTTNSYSNTITYAAYRSALASTGTSANDATVLSTLPGTAANPVNGNTDMDLSLPLLRALGFSEGNLAVPWDASVDLNVGLMTLDRSGAMIPGSYDLLQVTYHELNEVMGFLTALNGVPNSPVTVPSGPIQTADLFRFSAPGVRTFTSDPNQPAYFSINNGVTLLANYNVSDGGDRQDFNGSPSPSVQDAFSTPDIRLNNGLAEETFLDAIGYNVAPSAVPEPSTFAMLGLGGVFLVIARRRRGNQ